jgi:hypothetical protein
MLMSLPRSGLPKLSLSSRAGLVGGQREYSFGHFFLLWDKLLSRRGYFGKGERQCPEQFVLVAFFSSLFFSPS